MHSETELYKTQVVDGDLKFKTLENDLFTIRSRMLDIADKYTLTKVEEIKKMTDKPKSYAGPGGEFLDPVESTKIRKRETKAMKEMEWNSEGDIEAICNTFLEYLWTCSTTTNNALKAERLKLKIEE